VNGTSLPPKRCGIIFPRDAEYWQAIYESSDDVAGHVYRSVSSERFDISTRPNFE